VCPSLKVTRCTCVQKGAFTGGFICRILQSILERVHCEQCVCPHCQTCRFVKDKKEIHGVVRCWFVFDCLQTRVLDPDWSAVVLNAQANRGASNATVQWRKLGVLTCQHAKLCKGRSTGVQSSLEFTSRECEARECMPHALLCLASCSLDHVLP
jgi:hypothetical protein